MQIGLQSLWYVRKTFRIWKWIGLKKICAFKTYIACVILCSCQYPALLIAEHLNLMQRNLNFIYWKQRKFFRLVVELHCCCLPPLRRKGSWIKATGTRAVSRTDKYSNSRSTSLKGKPGFVVLIKTYNTVLGKTYTWYSCEKNCKNIQKKRKYTVLWAGLQVQPKFYPMISENKHVIKI